MIPAASGAKRKPFCFEGDLMFLIERGLDALAFFTLDFTVIDFISDYKLTIDNPNGVRPLFVDF